MTENKYKCECGNTDLFQEKDGKYFCVECGVESPGFIYDENDTSYHFGEGRHSEVRKVESNYSDSLGTEVGGKRGDGYLPNGIERHNKWSKPRNEDWVSKSKVLAKKLGLNQRVIDMIEQPLKFGYREHEREAELGPLPRNQLRAFTVMEKKKGDKKEAAYSERQRLILTIFACCMVSKSYFGTGLDIEGFLRDVGSHGLVKNDIIKAKKHLTKRLIRMANHGLVQKPVRGRGAEDSRRHTIEWAVQRVSNLVHSHYGDVMAKEVTREINSKLVVFQEPSLKGPLNGTLPHLLVGMLAASVMTTDGRGLSISHGELAHVLGYSEGGFLNRLRSFISDQSRYLN